MGWKYEISGDATLVEFAIPGTSELVSLGKGGKKSVELDHLVGELPPGVKVTETKTTKKAESEPEPANEEEAS